MNKKEVAVKALKLFNEKTEELLSSTFTKKVLAEGTEVTLQWNWDTEEEENNFERIGPNKEDIKAFVLDYRFFIQDNERSSFRNLKTIYSSTLLEMKDALGKKKIFVESEDEKSQLIIIKTLKKNGFEVVVNEKDAELKIKFDFKVNTANIGINPGIFGGISMNQNAEQKNGKLRVFIKSGSNEQMVFVKERQPSSVGKYIHKQAEDYTEDFIKELRKAENENNQIKK